MRRFVKDFLLPMAVAVALAFVIQAAVAKPYEIPTESMVPTIQANDRIIANRLIYRFRDIERGDIIVFHPPRVGHEHLRRRGRRRHPLREAGDRPAGRQGRGRATARPSSTGRPYVVDKALAPNYDMTWPVVPEGQLLVLGDNRPGSCDAHQWKPDPFVPEDNVIGQAEVIYWPLSHIAFLN